MTTRLKKSTAVLSTGLLALTLAACGSEDDTSPESDDQGQEQFDAFEDEDTQADPSDPDAQQQDDSEVTDSDEVLPDDAGDEAAAGDEIEVQIGESFEDTDTGDTIEINSAVRDFVSTEETEVNEQGGEIVLVEVSVTSGDDSTEEISNDNFRISWDDGTAFHEDDTDEIDDGLNESDREPFDEVSNGEESGWLAFFVEDGADTYLLEYSRPAIEDDDDDATEADFVEEVEIPAP